MSEINVASENVSNDSVDRYAGFSTSWKKRFEFFDQYGVPGWGKPDPRYTAGFKALGFWQRMSLGYNVWVVLFGTFYLMYLRLWRMAVVLAAIHTALIVAIVVADLDLPSGLYTGLGVGISSAFAARVNV
ncbi:MAG: DUF2628 domain-containing protein, partial [Rhodococcus sp.]|nr:DUF2628 domain-containing protein [Rhodococcus sp. (in: high G+C Gram-positive bacteria)]